MTGIVIRDLLGSFDPEEFYSSEELNELDIYTGEGTMVIEGRESLVVKVEELCSTGGSLKLLTSY